MYHALLTNRYLTTRVIPLVAVGAVGLCVALVIIVVSVMTGFLNMVRDSGRTLMGDVVVAYRISGIPHYDRLIERIEALPEAAAATPVADSWGLLRMPYPEGDSKEVETLQIWGIEPESFAKVTGYAETLEWRSLNEFQRERLLFDVIERSAATIVSILDEAQRRELLKAFSGGRDVDPQQLEAVMARMPAEQWIDVVRDMAWDTDALRKLLTDAQWKQILALDRRLVDDAQILNDGMTLKPSGPGSHLPGIALGIHVSIGNDRQRDGSYIPAGLWNWWMPRYSVVLTTLPVVAGGFVEPDPREFQIVN